MRKYLELFERYFQAKFTGGQREQSMELAKFLTGDALSAYKSFKGSEKRYSVLKERMLDWFKTYQVQGAKRWKRELRSIKMEEGGSFKMFAIQVQELAEKAYPNDKKECARRMQERFTKGTPQWFNEKLGQRQDMKEMMSLGHKLHWNDMIKQAEKEDKLLRDKRWKKVEIREEALELGVWQTQKRGMNYGRAEQAQHDKVFTNRNYSSNQEKQSPVNNYIPFVCYWCGQPGHIARNCRLNSRVCFICGQSGHLRSDCPDYRSKQTLSYGGNINDGDRSRGSNLPGNNSNMRERPIPRPWCPKCGGPHLGIHCRAGLQEEDLN